MKVEEDTAPAQGIEWDALNDEAMSLYRKGQYFGDGRLFFC